MLRGQNRGTPGVINQECPALMLVPTDLLLGLLHQLREVLLLRVLHQLREPLSEMSCPLLFQRWKIHCTKKPDTCVKSLQLLLPLLWYPNLHQTVVAANREVVAANREVVAADQEVVVVNRNVVAANRNVVAVHPHGLIVVAEIMSLYLICWRRGKPNIYTTFEALWCVMKYSISTCLFLCFP